MNYPAASIGGSGISSAATSLRSRNAAGLRVLHGTVSAMQSIALLNQFFLMNLYFWKIFKFTLIDLL